MKTNTLEIYEKGRRDCQQKRGLGARSYINAITEFERDHVHASHGAAKYERLAKIKGKHDPHNLFHHNANIRPA